MIYQVRLPQLELTMENVTVLGWLIAVDEQVTAEQPILEVETQKATVEVPSPSAGYVRKLCVSENDEIGENALLCIITDTADEPIENNAELLDTPATTSNGSSAKRVAIASAQSTRSVGPVRATPAARKRAKDLGVDLQTIIGTGPDGRITIDDVQTAATPSTDTCKSDEEEWTALSSTRVALISQMQRSLVQIPQFHVARQIDVTPLTVKLEGTSFTHHLIKATALALQQHPALRTAIKNNKLKICPVSVAVAMDTPHGLVAPALRNPDQLSIAQIAEQTKDMVHRAVSKELKRDELTDAPFAISNLGMFGVDVFHAFVFDGQTAVLAVGCATDSPSGGKIAWMSLAADHRVVDGAEAGRFLNTLQLKILQP